MATPVNRVFCAQPVYGNSHRLCSQQFDVNIIKPGSKRAGRVYRTIHGGSLLANTFNELWVAALNYQLFGTEEQREITHFAMLHDDMQPEDGWLDILLEELEKYDADVMSAVSPIKTLDGLTSTAIDDPAEHYSALRRITMNEVVGLPMTFDAADCGYPGSKLLVNSGCWVCDFTKPWRLASHEVDGRTLLKIRFHIDNEIRLTDTPAGPRYQARVASEDWNFSREILEVDPSLKVYATRKVSLSHYGTIPFGNQNAWGELKMDSVYENNTKNPVPIGAKAQEAPVFKTTKILTPERNGNGNGHQAATAAPIPKPAKARRKQRTARGGAAKPANT